MKTSRVAIAGVLLVALLVCCSGRAAQAAPPSAGDTACRLKDREAKDCVICCAAAGFNKFDSQGFQAGKGCHCFKDDKELAANARHQQRRP